MSGQSKYAQWNIAQPLKETELGHLQRCGWTLSLSWVLSRSVVSNSATLWTVAARLLCPWGFSRQESCSGWPCAPPGDLPKPGIEPRSPTLQVDSLLSEAPGKPRNPGVGSLPLLQGIFPTLELNRCLLHCRWILYQLSYQGSPRVCHTA